MMFCSHCGAMLDDSAVQCPACGAEIPQPPEEAHGALQTTPEETVCGREIPLDEGADAPPPKDAPGSAEFSFGNERRRAPAGPNYPRMNHVPGQNSQSMSTLQYLLMLLLFLVPFVGFIALLVLSFSASNGACRRLSRAMVICKLAITVLAAAAMAALWHTFSDVFYDSYLWDELPYYLPWDDYYDGYDDYFGYFGDSSFSEEDMPTAFTDRHAAAFTAHTGYTIL